MKELLDNIKVLNLKAREESRIGEYVVSRSKDDVVIWVIHYKKNNVIWQLFLDVGLVWTIAKLGLRQIVNYFKTMWNHPIVPPP